jgi:hypothetical protein
LMLWHTAVMPVSAAASALLGGVAQRSASTSIASCTNPPTR